MPTASDKGSQTPSSPVLCTHRWLSSSNRHGERYLCMEMLTVARQGAAANIVAFVSHLAFSCRCTLTPTVLFYDLCLPRSASLSPEERIPLYTQPPCVVVTPPVERIKGTRLRSQRVIIFHSPNPVCILIFSGVSDIFAHSCCD